jgi:hypothetical protein
MGVNMSNKPEPQTQREYLIAIYEEVTGRLNEHGESIKRLWWAVGLVAACILAGIAKCFV